MRAGSAGTDRDDLASDDAADLVGEWLARAPQPSGDREHPLGVLFVHGVGDHASGATLRSAGESLVGWLERWADDAGGDGEPEETPVAVRDAVLTRSGDGTPASAVVAVKPPGTDGAPAVRWLLAEGYWADTLTAPPFRELVRWAFEVVPWAVLALLTSRARMLSRRLLPSLRSPRHRSVLLTPLVHLAYLPLAVAAIPLLLAATLLVLLLGLVPLGGVRRAALVVQRAIATTLGDSYLLLANPLQAAAALHRVEEALSWLEARCDRLAVVAHSQGAALAHTLLHRRADGPPTLFVSYGSGLKQVEQVRQVRRDGRTWRAWLALPAGAVIATAVPGLVAYLLSDWVTTTIALTTVLAWAAHVVLPALEEGSGRSLPRAAGRLLLLLYGLLGPVVLGVREAAADDTSFVLRAAVGASVLLPAVTAANRRAVPDEEALLLGGEDLWLDYVATADLVPNGALLDDAHGRVHTVEVANRGSYLRDHTTYWRNTDEFVASIAAVLGAMSGVELRAPRRWDAERLAVARHRRRWRVAWLTAARTTALLGFTVLAVAWAGDDPLGGRSVATVLGDVEGWVPLLDTPLGRSVTDRVHGGVAAAVLAAAALGAGYLVLAAIWRWWEWRDLKLLVGRWDADAGGLPFAAFAVGLGAVAAAVLSVVAAGGEEVRDGVALALAVGVLVGLAVAVGRAARLLILRVRGQVVPGGWPAMAASAGSTGLAIALVLAAPLVALDARGLLLTTPGLAVAVTAAIAIAAVTRRAAPRLRAASRAGHPAVHVPGGGRGQRRVAELDAAIAAAPSCRHPAGRVRDLLAGEDEDDVATRLLTVAAQGWSGHPLEGYASTAELRWKLESMMRGDAWRDVPAPVRRQLTDSLVAHAIVRSSGLLPFLVALGAELPVSLRSLLEQELQVPISTLRIARLRGAPGGERFRERLARVLADERASLTGAEPAVQPSPVAV